MAEIIPVLVLAISERRLNQCMVAAGSTPCSIARDGQTDKKGCLVGSSEEQRPNDRRDCARNSNIWGSECYSRRQPDSCTCYHHSRSIHLLETLSSKSHTLPSGITVYEVSGMVFFTDTKSHRIMMCDTRCPSNLITVTGLLGHYRKKDGKSGTIFWPIRYFNLE